MSSDGELMMPVGNQEAWHQAQVLAMRQMAENLSAQTKRIEGMSSKVDDVRERLIRLEAQETAKAVDAVEAKLQAAMSRIDTLESQRDRVAGVAAFSSWIARSAPWLLAGVAAFLAGIGLKEFKS